MQSTGARLEGQMYRKMQSTSRPFRCVGTGKEYSLIVLVNQRGGNEYHRAICAKGLCLLVNFRDSALFFGIKKRVASFWATDIGSKALGQATGWIGYADQQDRGTGGELT